ncbi:MAG: hypothetical protein ACXWD8_07810 [Mycobacterium sp.]
MATTPTGYGRFSGRVGALAVALGIGAAIANSPGIAWAQDGPSGASDSSSGGAGTSNAGSTGASGAPASAGSGSAEGTDTSGEDANTGEDDDNESDNEESGNEEAPGDDETGDDDSKDEQVEEDGEDESSALNQPEYSAEAQKDIDRTSNMRTGRNDDSLTKDVIPSESLSITASRTVITSPDIDKSAADDTMGMAAVTDSPSISAASTFVAIVPQSTRTSQVTSPAATVTSDIGGVVSTVLSALGFGSQAASGPVVPPQPPMLWAMLGWVRRELGHIVSPLVSAAGKPVAALVAEDVSTTEVSPLATPEQLAAERIATQTANSLPVAIMKLVLRQQFLSAAHNLYGPNGVDAENMAALDEAVNEYAMGAAFQQQLLNSMTPKFITQVAPPHIWFGQNVPGSRILYDNPDTIYRFAGVNGASEYEIRGRFHDWDNLDARPSNVTFSVLEGLAGTTSTVLTVDNDFEVDENGNFVITVSREPANGRPNHLQLTAGSTIIAARDTLGDWNDEIPMSLSIERVGGPPNSLFAQLGGFAFLGNFVADNPLLTTLVSLIPPLPFEPPLLRGVFTAAILIVRGANEQAKYMELAITDPQTGEARPVNTVSQPASNAEFLANQKQSNGHFQLGDKQALVLTIDPGDAKYFVVPTYNIWTTTDNYWDEPASLNIEQARENVDENGVGNGTYTVVISPTDPLAANWVSTSGLNQGTLAIRFQDLDPDAPNQPQIIDQRVLTHEELAGFLPAGAFMTEQERNDELELRKAGFDRRWAQS